MQSWDRDYLDLADFWAQRRSKDPSSKIGAVIVRPNKTVVSMGFNGFPRGLSDNPELYADRDFKIAVVVHAEENAILTAREPLDGCILYVSGLTPCSHCASIIIQAGISCVVAERREIPDRWRANMMLATKNLVAAGVSVVLAEPGKDDFNIVEHERPSGMMSILPGFDPGRLGIRTDAGFEPL